METANNVVKARGDVDAARSRAIDLTEGYLIRRPYLNLQNVGYLGASSYLAAEPWRRVLYSSPTVWACVKALNDQLVALPWHITTKDKSQRHAKKGLIDYYAEEVVGKFNGENYDTGVMRMNRDVLTIPQGGNAEVVRKIAGKWDGEVDRVENIDGGTLTPTGIYDYPLIQRDPTNFERKVVFERGQVRRILMNPRPEYSITGYQQSPLEMCYLAIDALSKGDFYYLNLLTDTPSAGILDFADWTKEEAVTWAKSWRELLTGNDALKIPLVYEHEKPVTWIPFGTPPEQMMLPDTLQRYVRLVHACFGLYTQDTGLTREETTGGRESNLERRSWHRFNAIIALWNNFWNSILPKELVFSYEEVNIEETERLARAMVARANALGIMMRAGALGIKEVRREISETGMIETYINTEEIPTDTVMPGAFGGGLNPVVAGQSRWQEQRLPEEGRKQAMPASKRAPREEETNRVRPKSKANVDNLTAILASAFQKIATDIPDDALTQIIKDAGVILISALKEAKSFAGDAYDRWLDEFDNLMDDEDNSLIKAKAIIRKRKQSTKLIEELLKSSDWWNITNPELFDQARKAFKAAYEDALDDFADEVQLALYEEGYTDSPTPEDFTPSLVNAVIQGEIDAYAQQMMDKLNQGSQYYLKHALSRAITSQLSKPEYRQRINDDDDAAVIIATAGFVSDVATAFKSELTDLIESRAVRAAGFELGNIEGSARLQAMKSMGLANKLWVCYGPEPCLICLSNAAKGFVPLDYEYDSAFGTCLWTEAHPFGNCGIIFDRTELRAIIDSGGEITLYRGW